MKLASQPAFPHAAEYTDGRRPVTPAHPGMTLRQHLAACALQGLAANPELEDAFLNSAALAAHAVELADATLAALEGTK